MAITQYGKMKRIDALEAEIDARHKQEEENGVSQEELQRREDAYNKWMTLNENVDDSNYMDWKMLEVQQQQNQLMEEQNQLTEKNTNANLEIAKQEKKLQHQRTRGAIVKTALIGAGVSTFVGWKAAKGVMNGARKSVGVATNILKKVA